jgi:uncharacterized protein YqeY
MLIERLKEDMKAAMKAGEKLRLDTIRMLLAESKNLQVSKGNIHAELEEGDVLALLGKALKRREEAAQVYRDNNRPELAEKERAEAEIIRAYLPKGLTREETIAAVEAAIAAVGATGKRDLGKVMGAVMAQYKGRIDGKLVQEIVGSKLP